MKKIHCIVLISLIIIITSCGKGVVTVTNESYEPKLVIEGFLVAHQKVDKIRIARNFPIDANLNRLGLIPNVKQTHVTITDLETGKLYKLTFHVAEDRKFDNYYWEYIGKDLIIDYVVLSQSLQNARDVGDNLEKATILRDVIQFNQKLQRFNYWRKHPLVNWFYLFVPNTSHLQPIK